MCRADVRQGAMFSYVSLENRVPKEDPMRRLGFGVLVVSQGIDHQSAGLFDVSFNQLHSSAK